MTTIDRRNFIKKSNALLIGGLFAEDLFKQSSAKNKLDSLPLPGIQLVSISSAMTVDPVNSLKRLAKIGFKEIESASSSKGSYYGYKPKEFKKLIEDMGMNWRAHHAFGAPRKPVVTTSQNVPTPAVSKEMVALPNLRENYQRLVDEASEGGLKYLVCANTPVSTISEINQSIGTFQKTGEACKKAGLHFAYHNHATEFDIVEGGKSAYDLILSQTDESLVKMELDLAWSTKAGKDAIALFKEKPGRFPLWHVKDIAKDLNTITEIGDGIVDFKKIFEAKKTAGLEYFFIEHHPTTDPLGSVEACYNKLYKMLKS